MKGLSNGDPRHGTGHEDDEESSSSSAETGEDDEMESSSQAIEALQRQDRILDRPIDDKEEVETDQERPPDKGTIIMMSQHELEAIRLHAENAEFKNRLDSMQTEYQNLEKALKESKVLAKSAESDWQAKFKSLEGRIASSPSRSRSLSPSPFRRPPPYPGTKPPKDVKRKLDPTTFSCESPISDSTLFCPPYPMIRSSSLPKNDEEVRKLKDELEAYVEREERLEEELLQAREEFILKNEHLEESLRQIDQMKIEAEAVEASENQSVGTASHVTILHSQRAELAHRIRKLLDVNGQLRASSTTLRHRIERKDKTIENIKEQVISIQKDSAMSDAMLQRQLYEWEEYAKSIEQKLQETEHSLEISWKRSQRADVPRLLKELDELKSENNILLEQQQREQHSWDHEKNLLNRNIQALEEHIDELEMKLAFVNDKQKSRELYEDIKSRSDDSRSTNTAHLSEYSHSVRRSSLNGGSTAITMLQEKLRQMEAILQEKNAKETALNQEILALRHSAEKARNEAESAEARVELLHSYLESSQSSQPSIENSLQGMFLQNLASHDQQREEERLNSDRFEMSEASLKGETKTSARRGAILQENRPIRSQRERKSSLDHSNSDASKIEGVEGEMDRLIPGSTLSRGESNDAFFDCVSSSEQIEGTNNPEKHVTGSKRSVSNVAQEEKNLHTALTERDNKIAILLETLADIKADNKGQWEIIKSLLVCMCEKEMEAGCAGRNPTELHQGTLQKELVALQAQCDELEAKLEMAVREEGEFVDRIAELEAGRIEEIDRLKLENEKLAAKCEAAHKQLDIMTQNVSNLKAALRHKEASEIGVNSEATEDIACLALDSEKVFERCIAGHGEEDEQSQAIRDELDQIKQILQTKTAELSNMYAVLEQTQKDLQATALRLKDSRAEVEDLMSQVEDSRQRIHKLKGENVSLLEERAVNLDKFEKAERLRSELSDVNNRMIIEKEEADKEKAGLEDALLMAREECRKVELQLNETRDQLDEHRAIISDLRDENDNLKQKLNDSHEEKRQAVQSCNEYRSEATTLKSETEALTRKIEQIQELFSMELTELGIRFAESQSRINELEEEVEARNTTADSSIAEKQDVGKLEEVLNKNSQLSEELKRISIIFNGKDATEVKSELETYKTQLETSRSSMEILEKEVTSLKDEVSGLKFQITQISSPTKSPKSKLSALEKDRLELQEKLAQTEDALAKEQECCKSFQQQMNNLQTTYEIVCGDRDKLEIQKERLNLELTKLIRERDALSRMIWKE